MGSQCDRGSIITESDCVDLSVTVRKWDAGLIIKHSKYAGTKMDKQKTPSAHRRIGMIFASEPTCITVQ
jgi:hypothetical protein